VEALNMKVFISWSGTRSEYVAKALSEWLRDVIQNVEPWISKHIESGATWGRELGDVLKEANFGVACITPENQFAPWILFEAGAIVKGDSGARFCPYLIGMKSTDLELPLSSFQGNLADRDGTWALVQSINKAQTDKALDDRTLERGFERCWPEFDEKLKTLPAVTSNVPQMRDPLEIQAETLEIVRRMDYFVSELGADIRSMHDSMAPRERTDDERATVAEALKIFGGSIKIKKEKNKK
jgi:hypothetical protein